MWLIDKYGNAVNLSKCHCIYFCKDLKRVSTNYIPDLDVSYDLKDFNNEVDAKKYIADLVKKMNGEEN